MNTVMSHHLVNYEQAVKAKVHLLARASQFFSSYLTGKDYRISCWMIFHPPHGIQQVESVLQGLDVQLNTISVCRRSCLYIKTLENYLSHEGYLPNCNSF